MMPPLARRPTRLPRPSLARHLAPKGQKDAMIASSLQRVSSLLLAAVVGATSVPALAAAPVFSAGAVVLAAAPAPAPTTDGKTIGLMRFTGSPAAAELRASLQPELESEGYTVKGVAVDLPGAAKAVKCKGEPESDECLAAIGKWVAGSKTPADYLLFGSVGEAPGNEVHLVLYDTRQSKRIETIDTAFNPGDLIMPLVLPRTLVTALEHHKTPPPGPTEDDLAAIAALDEPDKTPEEIAAEQRAIAEAEAEAAAAQQDQVISTAGIEADLKADFEQFCRKDGEPRRKRKTKEEPKDLRPACKRGPFWGYWQPRAWVALGLTTGTALGTIALYSAALAARGPYKDAVDALDAYTAAVGGDPRRDPNLATSGDQSYASLATEVSATGAVMRRRAIIGDVLLGTTVLLGGVLAIIIYQDRTDAKRFIKEEKSLKAISDVRVGPMLSRETQGVGLHFRF
jgi:hypothetical protein